MLRKSLSAVRVLDFTQIGAGPVCTMLLSDLGADVIKVEPPEGDIGRKLGPPWYKNESPVFLAFNRGKRSICLDLKSEEGREKALLLARRSDVIVESFRPGVMDRLGLGYEALGAIKPTIIYCSVSGFGQTGPSARRAGVDGILQAASGLMSLIGSGEGSPLKVQAPVVDVMTGYIAAVGVLARIACRKDPNFVGGHLDVNLFASAIALQQSAITSYLGTLEKPLKIGSAAPYSAPNEAFPTADGWIMVAAYTGNRWPKLCEILNVPGLEKDLRFETSSKRVENRPAMYEVLSAAFRVRSTAFWLAQLDANDILCSKVSDYEDLLADEQLKHLKMITELSRSEDRGTFLTPAFPINSREECGMGYAAPPELGEHSREIMSELVNGAGN